MMTRYAFLLLSLALVTDSLAAASEWLPPEVQEALTLQLAKGLQEVDFGDEAKPEEIIAAAQVGMASIIGHLESLGVEGVIEIAPAFNNIGLPTTDNRFARAIGAYGICSVTLHPELATNAEERLFVTFGIVAVVIVSAYLRHGHLATGGNDDALKQYLTSEAMNQLGRDVQINKELRDRITLHCGPMLASLLE